MSVAIIDYGSGNLRSAAKALERAAGEIGSTQKILVTADPKQVQHAERIVLPGVGAFADCNRGLRAVPGMVDALTEAVIAKGRPFLGICVGMQLMASRGLEYGEHLGLGWIEGDVVRLEPADKTFKVPHIGWNELQLKGQKHPVLSAIGNGNHGYFVHSYSFRPKDSGMILAQCDYGQSIAAIIGRDNLIGTQFHPEKSQATGLNLLRGFLAWQP